MYYYCIDTQYPHILHLTLVIIIVAAITALAMHATSLPSSLWLGVGGGHLTVLIIAGKQTMVMMTTSAAHKGCHRHRRPLHTCCKCCCH